MEDPKWTPCRAQVVDQLETEAGDYRITLTHYRQPPHDWWSGEVHGWAGGWTVKAEGKSYATAEEAQADTLRFAQGLDALTADAEQCDVSEREPPAAGADDQGTD